MTDRSLGRIIDRVPGPLLTLTVFLVVFILIGPALIYQRRID